MTRVMVAVGWMLCVMTCAQPVALGAAAVQTSVESQQTPVPPQTGGPSGEAQRAFEVASVKENTSGSRQSNFATTPGRVTATNVWVIDHVERPTIN